MRLKRPKFKMPDLSNSRVRTQMGLYAAAVVIGGLFFVAAAFPLASNPTFCGVACHSQAPQWESWKLSAHSKVTCYACHVDVLSPKHLLREKLIAGPLGIFNTVFDRHEKPINAESKYSAHLPMERCERCHDNANRKFTFSKGIKMNHEAHKEAGVACAICHNRVAHKGAEEFEPLKSWPEAKEVAEHEGKEKFEYKNFLTMKEGCFRCHSGSPESRDQEILHLIENGKEPPQECTTCHDEDSDVLPEGHGTNAWRAGHGAVAKRDFGACFECHAAGAKFDDHGKPWCGLCHDEAKVEGFLGQQGSSDKPAAPAEAPAEAPAAPADPTAAAPAQPAQPAEAAPAPAPEP